MKPVTNKYDEMSQEYLGRAGDYLDQGDLKQASEKSWGAVACALKSIAEQRGWHHRSHALLNDLSSQFADELSLPGMRDLFAVARSMHQNFYENWFQEDEVEYGVGRVREYLPNWNPSAPTSRSLLP